MNISAIDLVVIVVYLLGVLGLGVWSARRRTTTANEYFLAGRSLGWVMVGAALFATNISTIHLVGLAASGYNEGMVWGNFEWMASFCLIALALFFAPFYFRSGIQTLPEFLERKPGNALLHYYMALQSMPPGEQVREFLYEAWEWENQLPQKEAMEMGDEFVSIENLFLKNLKSSPISYSSVISGFRFSFDIKSPRS